MMGECLSLLMLLLLDRLLLDDAELTSVESPSDECRLLLLLLASACSKFNSLSAFVRFISVCKQNIIITLIEFVLKALLSEYF